MFYQRTFLIIACTVLSVFLLTGCGSVPTTPTTTNNVDFRTCENILLAWYQALSAENFPLALSYCKTGGISFEYTNNLWRLSMEYPGTDVIYTVKDIYAKEYINPNAISMRYDYCYDFYYNGFYSNTKCESYFLVLFEKVSGEWKLA